jgi:hypothetical protein
VRLVSAVGFYAVVRGGKCTYLHNNLGAYEILEVSVAGPELTLRFLDAYHRVAHDGDDIGWSPDAYTYANCEGGLLVDCDKRVLMMFTEHRFWPVRTAYLDTVGRTWPGWQVRWAYDGIADMERHLGIDPTAGDRPVCGPRPLYPRGRGDQWKPDYVVTVAGPATRPAVYGPNWHATPPWWVGPALLDELDEADRDPVFTAVPSAGMHLDPATRTAGIWAVERSLDGLTAQWPRVWPGWRLEFWEDQIPQHLARCGDAAVHIPLPDAQRCALELAGCVVNTWLFFLAEDIDHNYLVTEEDEHRIAWRRQDPWKLSREQTAMTFFEMATLLQAITGRPYHRPRWPDTMDEIRAALR